MVDTRVDLCGITLDNPVIPASGTFGYGYEFGVLYDINCLGTFSFKGTTLNPRFGNETPRIAECPSGMLNAVGLQNKGVDYFVEHLYPIIKEYDTHMIVNVSGSTIEDYVACAEKLANLEKMPAIELNISCPNVKEGGMAFGTSCQSATLVTREVRKVFPKTLIVKLSPNVTSISEIARGVEDEGADAVSLVNTFLGMAIDVESRRPKLSTITGGLSGPCIKPIAIRMVWEVFNAVKIPVIGMGGICHWQDAIEFILAGASAVQVGTFNFIDPTASVKIVEGIHDYLERHHISSVDDLVGKMIV